MLLHNITTTLNELSKGIKLKFLKKKAQISLSRSIVFVKLH